MVKRLLLVALVVLSLTGVAYGWGVLGTTGNISSSGGTGGVGTWASGWSESSQEGLTGFDYCVFFDSGVSGTHETGYSANGVFSGNSLQATQNGGISGASGSARKTDGIDDYFTYQEVTVPEYIAAEANNPASGVSNWFFAWKLKSLTHPTGTAQPMFSLYDTLTSTYLRINITTTGTLQAIAELPTAGNTFLSETDNAIPAGVDDTPTIVCFWYDGTGPYIGAGFMNQSGTTRPTKFTEFDSGSAVSKAVLWNSTNFQNTQTMVSDASGGVTAHWIWHCATTSTIIADN